MAQTGFTPIQLYFSSTTTNAPLAANLASGELAINITDGKLFYKDNANAVQVIGWKVVPATAGGTGQTSYAVGDLLYANTTTTLAKLADVATGNALISGGVGVAPSYGKIGLTTHVSGTLPTANGGTNLTSFTANGLVYASSSSALATGSAITFDGSNFATTGTASATKFIPTGGSATGNGMYLPASNEVAISTAGVERLRYLSDGSILAGTTDSGFFGGSTLGVGLFATNGFIASSRGGAPSAIFNRYTSDGEVVQFRNSGSTVGSVSVTAVLTTYNTTSDYRLKTVVGAVTGHGERLDALEPIEYTWNLNGSSTRGFLAHKFQEVYAGSVTGEKDAVDEDGKPVYQSMQAGSSEVIADLVAELQSLRKRVASLEAK